MYITFNSHGGWCHVGKSGLWFYAHTRVFDNDDAISLVEDVVYKSV